MLFERIIKTIVKMVSKHNIRGFSVRNSNGRKFICPECKECRSSYIDGKWFCSNCGFVRWEKDAYVDKHILTEYLGISARTIEEWVRQRIIPFYRLSNKANRFRIDEIDKVLKKSRVKEVEVKI